MMSTTYDERPDSRTTALAYGIWFVSAALAVVSFFAGRSMVIRTYLRFFPEDAWKMSLGQGGLSLVNILISLPLALVVIAIIIGGFEFQHRHMGKSQGWWMLARTLSLEFGILLLANFI